ncbi:conserved exported hypothetical protein [Carnobacterium maltaromaticum]|uniref:Ig-like domain-containing protein n=1 Tax=Carnobacterium maltaromaticum TaxID=2751 RepID=UPI00191BA82F|nr:Ig-like domain-containing protein [Carnobacterium maltaromaticum]CAD5900447.1 conserved exported hypothetical protein [Carnobacterium maltaromaticum]
MNKNKRNVTSALVLGLVSMGILGVGIKADATTPNKMYAPTAVSQANLLAPNVLNSLPKAEKPIDVSVGWDVMDYTSSLNVGIDKVFAEGQVSLSGVKYATTNFFNIGKSHFKATKTIPMKKGKTYNLDLVYGLRAQGKAIGHIDFNGTTITETAMTNTAYTETVVAKKDQDYVITMEFTAPKNSGMFLMVGANDTLTGGIVVIPNVDIPLVNVPEAGTKLVSGTGKAGNLIKVMNELNEVIGTGKVKADGSFEVMTNKILAHDDKLTVIQSNGEDDSDPVSTTVKDTMAPDSPMIKDIEISNQMIKGTGEANSLITVKNTSGVSIGTGVADANGQIEFKLNQEVALGDKVYVTATDGAGNVSNSSEAIAVDSVKPAAPSVDPMDDQMLKLVGNAWKPNSKVEIQVGNQYYSMTSGKDNKFEYTFSKPWKVGTVITVTTTDISGNVSLATTIIVTSEKKTDAPLIHEVGDNHTAVTGTSEPNALIEVKVGLDYYKGKADSKGNFSIEMNTAYPVDTAINVTATGISGKSSDSTTIKVTDTTAPDSLNIEKITDASTVVNGTTEGNALVEAVITTPTGNKYYFEASADANGNFSINLDGTFPVNSTISFTATDASGNTSTPMEKTIENSKVLGVEMDTITSDDTSATGETTRPNTEVVIKVNNQIFKTTSDENGEFEINLPKLYEVGTPYEFYTVDGSEKTIIEKGVVLPRAVTIEGGSNLHPGDTELTGVGDSLGNVTIRVKDAIGSIVSEYNVVADKGGNFNLSLSAPLVAGDFIEAIQEVNGVNSVLSGYFVGVTRILN